MRPILLPAQIPGVPLRGETIDAFKAKLRGAYRNVVSERTTLAFPAGWAWVIADLVQDLQARMPLEERSAALPLGGLMSNRFDPGLLIHYSAPTVYGDELARQAWARTCRICERCGAPALGFFEGRFRHFMYCVLCRAMANGELKLIKAVEHE